MVKNLLDGNLESTLYEDQLREMYGIHAYIAFTMDKLVQNIVRQLQHIAGEENCLKVKELYEEEKANLATGGRVTTAQHRQMAENSYQKRAETALAEENCFKVMIFKQDCRLTIELLDTEHEPSDDPVEVERWSEYVEKYVNNEDSVTDELKDLLSRKPVFLPRNVRQWRQRNKNQKKTEEEVNIVKEESTSDKENETTNNNISEIDTNVKEGEKEKEITEDKESSQDPDIPKPSEDIDIIDNTECKFNVNSFKLVYVVNSESYLYKRMALQRAKESHKKVSLKLHEKFASWVSKWNKDHVTPEMEKMCSDWLMGDIEDLKPCITTKREIDNENAAPYYVYSKYKVKLLKETDSEPVD